ncbi:MAG: heavy metal translocating P-type ATPase [Dehalococcoidia bacterium]|nr:heavy metal translocating P-type ATPase [Dehalococcoidia bacterium]
MSNAHDGHGNASGQSGDPSDHSGLHAPPSASPASGQVVEPHDSRPHAGIGAGHDRHAGHDPELFKKRFWLSLIVTVPVVLFSEMVQDWFGYSLDGIPGHELVAPVLGSFVFVYGGHVFLIGGWRELRDGQPGMMILISLAISVAFIASLATTAGLLDLEFWWELGALVTVMLFGHWQEMAALGRTRGALAALAELIPDEAERLSDHGSEIIPISALSVGDTVLVRPGARVPADGTIEEGHAEFDESMLTGESRPIPRSAGERVAAGTVALGSAARVRVNALGEDTALAGIQRMVAEAQASRSRAQALADRAAAALFYIAIAAGLVAFIVWTLSGDIDAAIERTVTVLVIACPHALGLAIPLVIAISTEVAARNGILVKERLALERMRTVDVVLFDKTGTLTEGSHVVRDSWAADGNGEAMLRLAAAAEMNSEHPLARAIVRAAQEQGQAPQASDFQAAAGRGVSARVDGHLVEVGGPRLLAERGLDEATVDAFILNEWRARGASVQFVIVDSKLKGAIALEDKIREVSRKAIDGLHRRGLQVAMITGDARNVAEAVARDLGIDEVFAEVLPENKAKTVSDLQGRGHRVAMVGDGVNDAPALAQADVGVAIGAGTDVAIESAGVVLASDDPRAVLAIAELSRASYRKMVQNLAWATGYNVVAIPIAAGALAFADINITPAIGAVFMSLSTIIVALNAQLLRGINLQSV